MCRTVDLVRYNAEISKCKVRLKLPSPPVDWDISPIPGLALRQDGYLCQECPRASESAAVLGKHYRDDHPQVSRPRSQCHSTGPIQRFNASQANTWFRVLPPPQPQAALSAMDETFRNAGYALLNDSGIDPSTADNVQNVTAWLRLCLWHKHTKDVTAATASAFVAPPTGPVLGMLTKAVEAYVTKCEASIEKPPVLVRKRINSEDPATQ